MKVALKSLLILFGKNQSRNAASPFSEAYYLFKYFSFPFSMYCKSYNHKNVPQFEQKISIQDKKLVYLFIF